MAEIEWLMLANDAEVLGNRLFLMGGGWDTLTPSGMPFLHTFAIAVSLLADWDDVVQEREHRIEIAHVPAGGDRKLLGTSMAKLSRAPQMREGEKQRAQFAVKLALQFDKSGTHDIVVTLHGRGSKSVRFFVNPAVASPEAPPTRPEPRSRRRR